MLVPGLVVVWAMVFGISPGIALIVGAAVVMVLDGVQPDLLDRLQGRTAG